MNDLPIDPIPDGLDIQAGPAPQRAPRGRPRTGQTREPTRDAPRDGVFYGRDGEILSRRRTQAGDIFDVPLELRDPDWDYQWNAVTVNGNSEVLLDQTLMMSENGWRPVPADRHGFAGRFTPIGTKGSIIRGGQRLDERPKAMSDLARREEFIRARGQMADQNEALTGHKVNLRENLAGQDIPMTQGFPKRGARKAVSMSMDLGDSDIPKPTHQLADSQGNPY